MISAGSPWPDRISRLAQLRKRSCSSRSLISTCDRCSSSSDACTCSARRPLSLFPQVRERAARVHRTRVPPQDELLGYGYAASLESLPMEPGQLHASAHYGAFSFPHRPRLVTHHTADSADRADTRIQRSQPDRSGPHGAPLLARHPLVRFWRSNPRTPDACERSPRRYPPSPQVRWRAARIRRSAQSRSEVAHDDGQGRLAPARGRE